MFEGHTQVTCPIMVRLSCVMLCHHFLLMVCMETVLTAIQSSSWHYCKCWSQLGPIWYANGLRPVTKMGQHWLFLSRTVFVMLAHCQTPPHSWFVPETVKFVSSVDNSTTFLVIVCPFSLSVCVCVWWGGLWPVVITSDLWWPCEPKQVDHTSPAYPQLEGRGGGQGHWLCLVPLRLVGPCLHQKEGWGTHRKWPCECLAQLLQACPAQAPSSLRWFRREGAPAQTTWRVTSPELHGMAAPCPYVHLCVWIFPRIG